MKFQQTSFSAFFVDWKESCILLLKLGGERNISLISVLMFDVVFKATILSLFSSELASSAFLPWNKTNWNLNCLLVSILPELVNIAQKN